MTAPGNWESGCFWTNAFWILCRRKRSSIPLADLLEEYPGPGDIEVLYEALCNPRAAAWLRAVSSDTELLARMQKAGQPWAVSEPAQAAGIAALQAEGFREQTLRLVTEERAFPEKGPGGSGLSCAGRAGQLPVLPAAGRRKADGAPPERGHPPPFLRELPGAGSRIITGRQSAGRAENERLLAALGKVVGQT